MTDKELYNNLKPLEPKMREFEKTNGCKLTIDDLNIIKSVYPKLIELSSGHIKSKFNTGCSTCVRETFRIVINIYNSLMAKSIVIKK